MKISVFLRRIALVPERIVELWRVRRPSRSEIQRGVRIALDARDAVQAKESQEEKGTAPSENPAKRFPPHPTEKGSDPA